MVLALLLRITRENLSVAKKTGSTSYSWYE
jgi:hypothetical protein